MSCACVDAFFQRFRGRSVRLRFLHTSLKVGGGGTWESVFTYNPIPYDDGWWIDDVSLCWVEDW